MVDAIESRLSENQWLGGQQPSKEDSEEFAKLGGSAPNVDTHPNAFAWFSLVAKFTDAVRGTWAAAAAAAPAGVSILEDSHIQILACRVESIPKP